MFRVTVINNVERQNVIVDGSTSIRQILEMTNLSGVNATPVINGYTIGQGDLDVTLAELGVPESCTLSLTKPLNNAVA